MIDRCLCNGLDDTDDTDVQMYNNNMCRNITLCVTLATEQFLRVTSIIVHNCARAKCFFDKWLLRCMCNGFDYNYLLMCCGPDEHWMLPLEWVLMSPLAVVMTRFMTLEWALVMVLQTAVLVPFNPFNGFEVLCATAGTGKVNTIFYLSCK